MKNTNHLWNIVILQLLCSPSCEFTCLSGMKTARSSVEDRHQLFYYLGCIGKVKYKKNKMESGRPYGLWVKWLITNLEWYYG